MLQELIVINSKPAIVTVNFDKLKAELAKELEKYNILVTAETLADAKKLATELNKTKKVIDDRRKEEVAKASEPVKKFDDDMKELVKMCADGRQSITDQVKRFEDETRAEVAKLLSGARDFLWDKHGVKSEFFRTEFDDLIKISALTATGKLTKSVKDDLTYRVLDDKRIQDRIEMRLLKLENQSFQAGLDAPLSRHHVNTFLFAEDDVYQAEIDKIIAAELDRQKQAEVKVRQRVEAEKAREAQQEPAPAPIEKPIEVPADPAPAAEIPSAPAGKDGCTVTCVFAIEVPHSVSSEAVEAELRKVMQKAGITSLQSVSVERAAAKAAA